MGRGDYHHVVKMCESYASPKSRIWGVVWFQVGACLGNYGEASEVKKP